MTHKELMDLILDSTRYNYKTGRREISDVDKFIENIKAINKHCESIKSSVK